MFLVKGHYERTETVYKVRLVASQFEPYLEGNPAQELDVLGSCGKV